jgi:hypothetical protein
MASRYWVGGTATWDGTAGSKWATTSGGAGGAAVPTSSDDVFFDAGSGTCTVTTSGTTTDVCNNLDLTSANVTISHANNTTIGISGNLNITAGTWTIGGTGSQLSFLSTATGKTITTSGKTLPKLLFDGSGGDWALQDNLLLTNGQAITLTNGTLKPNGKNVGGASNSVSLSASGTSTRGIDCSGGTSTWTIGNTSGTAWNIADSTNFTMTSGGNLTVSYGITGNSGTFAGGGLTYGTFSCTSMTTGSLTISGANTFTTLTTSNGSNNTSFYSLAANQTVSGTWTANGNSVINRVLIRSSVKGTARTITAGTVTVTNIDLQDITGAGAGSWNISAVSGGSGDCGGNTGITFTTPVNRYWVTSGGTSTGSFSVTTRWSASSGGAGGATAPLPQDTAYFDANSIDAGSRTLTNDKPRMCAMDWTGVTNTPAFAKTTACSLFGLLTLVNGMTQSGTVNYTIESRSASTITAGSTTFTNPLIIDTASATVTFGDSITSSNTLTLTSGTASATSKTLTFTSLGTGATCTLDLVSSSLVLSATGTTISGSGTGGGGGLAGNPLGGFVR